MLKNIPSYISRILATSILMFIMFGVIAGVHSYDQRKALNNAEVVRVQQIHELEWQFIQGVLFENYDKADTFAVSIRGNVEKRLKTEYNSEQQLRQDLDYPTDQALAFRIFTEEIRGKYLNGIKNDDNDPFIATPKGISSDLSLNCSPDGSQIRTWEVELSSHANQGLSQKAVTALILQSNRPIFWEYLPSTNPNHEKIELMELSEIHRVFLNEGLDGLRTYEFLKPSYIRENEDIFGTPDVTNIGTKQRNYKLIVISGFNLYDVITTKHGSEMAVFEEAERTTKLHLENAKAQNTLYNVLTLVVLIFCIAWIALINNQVVKLISLDEDDSSDQDELKKGGHDKASM